MIKLSSLRVVAEMDAEAYVRGMAQKVKADQEGIASSKAVGAALAAQDVAAEKMSGGVTKLSRSYIEGYRDAANFETAVRAVSKAMDTGMDAGRAVVVLDSLYRKFGQVANAAQLAKSGFVSVAPVVEALNQRYEIAATAAQRLRQETESLARAQQAQTQINSTFGIGRPVTSARDSADAFMASYGCLDGIARLKADEAAKAFTSTLEATMIRGTAKAARDSASVFSAELDRLDEIARMKATEAGQAFAADFNARMGIGRSARASGATTSALTEMFAAEDADIARRKNLTAQLLPDLAEEENHKRNLQDINRLLANQPDLLERATAAEIIRNQQAMRSIEGMNIMQDKYARGTGLARHELINLSRQVQDVVVSLQGGQAFTTVMLQQGTQILDIFAASSADMGAVFKQAIGMVGQFMASTAGVASTIAIIGVSAAVAGYKFSESQREVERSLGGVGRASGVTLEAVNRIALQYAAAAQVSTSAARQIVAGFGATGLIGAGNAQQLLMMARDYGAQTGQDTAAAAAELAKAFADPAKGADLLNERLGFLDAKTRSYIRSLQDQNNTSEAQRALMQAMSSSIDGAASRLGILERAWHAIKTATSDALDAFGRAIGGQATLSDRLQYATAAQDARRTNTGLRGQSAANVAAIARGDADIYNLQEAIRLEGRLQAERRRTAEFARNSLAASDVVKKLFPEEDELKAIRRDLSDIDRVLASIESRAAFGNDAALNRSRDALQRGISTFLSPEERERRSGALSVQSIEARTLAERAAVASAQAALDLAGKAVTGERERLSIANKVAEVYAQARRDAQDAVKAANDNLSLAGLNPFQRAMREADIRYRENMQRFGGLPAAGVGGLRDANIPVSSGGSFYGLNQAFGDSLKQMIEDAAAQGIKIGVTSGYRSFEQQAKLYAEKGPGWAAPPGRSQHNVGLAADLSFGPGAREWAHENAARYGLHFPLANRAKNPEAWHIEPINGRSMVAGDGVRTNMSGADAARHARDVEKQIFVTGQLADMARNAANEAREQDAALEILRKTIGASAFDIAKMNKEQDLLNQIQRQGIPVTDEMKKQISELASMYASGAAKTAEFKMAQDILFERQQLGRTSSEQGIAARLRNTGIGMDSETANQLRLNDYLKETQSLVNGIGQGLLSGFINGKRGAELFRSVALNALNSIASKSMDMLTSGLMGALVGKGQTGGGGILGNLMSSFFSGGGGVATGMPMSIIPSAYGNVFGRSGVVPFALGGAFSNSIVSKPTLFPFAQGTGLMGEAGPEAIMPLKRNARGQLGVYAERNSGAGVVVQTPPPIIQIIDNAGVQKRQESSTGPDGRRMTKIVIDAVNKGVSSGGLDDSMGRRFGASPRAIRR